MRWLRWAAGTVAAVALLTLTAAVFFTPTHQCDDSATGGGAAFTGEVVANDDGSVTFRVDEVVKNHPIAGEPTLGLEPGQEVTVAYGDDARFLHTGESYLVPTFGAGVEDLQGRVHHGPCGYRGGETTHADGSAIDTGILTRDGFAPYAPKLALTIIAAAAIALMIRWRIRVKHPRLTIDGQPLAKKT
jgi:hypothetical protein